MMRAVVAAKAGDPATALQHKAVAARMVTGAAIVEIAHPPIIRPAP